MAAALSPPRATLLVDPAESPRPGGVSGPLEVPDGAAALLRMG